MKKATRSAKSTDAPKAAVPTDGDKAARPPKQAVVIIHGMGEQRPMETLRDFVRAVWESDGSIKEAAPSDTVGPKAHPKASDEKPAVKFFPDRLGDAKPADFKPKLSWMAPDTKTGSTELYRITTAPTDDGYRVDFYEMYWADIMRGSTLSHLRAWVGGLLLRWPHHVPPDVIGIWLLLWLSLALLVFFALAAAPNLIELLGFGGLSSTVDLLPEFVTKPFAVKIDSVFYSHGEKVIFVLLLSLISYWLARALLEIGRVARAEGDRRKFWLGTSRTVAVLIAALLVILACWVAKPLADMTLKSAIAFLAVFVILVVNSFVVPYFGDVARYVQATPETIAQRAAIRERGVRLLKALHEQEKNGQPTYGRVILVGHSLGSIIAYDLLMQYWAEAGPLRTVLKGKMLDEWRGMDDFLANKPFDLAVYQQKQMAIMKAMLAAGKEWLITDFVTIGSPLAHAEFLITHNANRFRDLVLARALAKSPPYPYGGGSERVYYTVSEKRGRKHMAVHHAAPFAAVRWTNIFDKWSYALSGDVISGSCRENFGEGIEEHDVTIRRRTGIVKRSRFFTHTSYWDMDAAGAEKDGGEMALTHIGVVRRALGIDRYGEFYPADAKAVSAPYMVGKSDHESEGTATG